MPDSTFRPGQMPLSQPEPHSSLCCVPVQRLDPTPRQMVFLGVVEL